MKDFIYNLFIKALLPFRVAMRAELTRELYKQDALELARLEHIERMQHEKFQQLQQELQQSLKTISERFDELNYKIDKLTSLEYHQQLTPKLQDVATQTTAEYIIGRLNTADVFYSQKEVMSHAISKASLSNDAIILEFGVFEGLSVNHIASLVNNQIYGFDSFEGLPEDWRSGFGKGVFSISNLPEVKENITLIKGWFNETLPDFEKSLNKKIALIHIDSDLYSSAKTIFEILQKHITSGCIIVFDEYFNYPGWQHGEYKALQEFIASHNLQYKYLAYNSNHEQVAIQIL